MNGRAESKKVTVDRRPQINKSRAFASRLSAVVGLLCSLCCLLSAVSPAKDPTPPRLFFSDANISVSFPNNWEVRSRFPYGPLFSKSTRYGDTALISCAVSDPLEIARISSDISLQALKELATTQLKTTQPGYKALSQRDRVLSGHNVFEITWDAVIEGHRVRHMTDYFFVENRLYALTLQSPPKTFKWSAMDFQNWLRSLQILSRQDAGALQEPAHGGLWIHQTGGVKITIPVSWLIAVSDDRSLGATFAPGAMHTTLTATVDVSSPASMEFSRRDKKEAARAIRKKGLRILRETEEAFHGFPAYHVEYDGMLKGDRLIKGMDIWVLTPKGRWLFSLEGDVTLYNSLSEQYDQILKEIEFI